jgi:hypothetical protein
LINNISMTWGKANPKESISRASQDGPPHKQGKLPVMMRLHSRA